MDMVLVILSFLSIFSFTISFGQLDDYEWPGPEYSVVGDPGMRNSNLRLAIDSWNYCNKVGYEAPKMGSPAAADCFDVHPKTFSVHHRVTEADNRLSVGNPFPSSFRGQDLSHLNDPDLYAVQKELYLGSKCEVHGNDLRFISDYYQFWMITLRNGNLDTHAGLCPSKGRKVGPFEHSEGGLSCFGKGCMNQPLMFHNYTSLQTVGKENFLRGSFFGTYDLDVDFGKGVTRNISYYSVSWEKKLGEDKSWAFHHFLRTSDKYPSLKLTLKSDTAGGKFGYGTRGMTKDLTISPDFEVIFTLNVLKGGGASSQFNLLEMRSCWRNDGLRCEGNSRIDVNRYFRMILSPNTTALCSPTNLKACPPYHITRGGSPPIYRNDTANFPYEAYHSYCAPSNAGHLQELYQLCDPYSNPMPQEIIKILPHPVWESYGFPKKQEDGWIGDSRKWKLKAGQLAFTLPFYQDPGTVPMDRSWDSIGVGTEVFMNPDQVVEWTISDFDILMHPRPHD
uniref:DUF7705 domain-containing protein n=1 Tax=Nelumbo nucifera TaxID=4432 RepID=A0A822ZQC4_NELNU|nr:TPA_asm: hypothetical protein HUJ06_002238 [Nelumbo nucifera]